MSDGGVLELFHPLVGQWFAEKFGQPTEPQRLGWPEICACRHTLIAAPTGSGKTLSAFLVCIDRLLRQALEGSLQDQVSVVYVSPLKALSNDIQRNLNVPLAEIHARALSAGKLVPEIRAALRTGDTPATLRQAMLRRPPHILVTTPESLFILLTSNRAREKLRRVQTVIVDEIHALARDKRGAHLALSLERLEALCETPPVRIGLSATQRPMDEMARFLVGARYVAANGAPRCSVIDVGHVRELDLAIEVPPLELSAVCSNEHWEQVYARLAELITQHRSTLVFVNTRRLAERVAHSLSKLLGEDAVASHHGSLSKELRLSAEQRLQEGRLRAIVATASLELGIDVGYIDLVCQVSTPRSIATLLQRVGRAGHHLKAVPKGRLFPLTRDDLMECLALVRAARARRLDAIEPPVAPVDILAQQIVAETATRECREDELFTLCTAAWPFRNVSRREFDAVLSMASEGIGRGQRKGAYLHRDRINGVVRGRRGARLAAITSGGAIPDTADYRVVHDADGAVLGTVNEDFAIESLEGDSFLGGNAAWIVCDVRNGEVIVSDAHGAPATIPFWLGEAPGRTWELSGEVSRLRQEIAALGGNSPEVVAWLRAECGAPESAARQACAYVAAQVAAVGFVPTREEILFERFFDDAGGMQLVIHAPLGSRINRAWGLALRKRFCRSFNFELQAAADDNGIVLSLGPQHSFPLEQMFTLLNTSIAREILVQALLAAPMFQVRWRWNVTRALAVLRQQGGKKVPPQLLRMRADDLLAAVFPMATACLENVIGDIEVPDHPLVKQTVHDCLHEAMDLDRWMEVLHKMQQGQVKLVGRDTREPSPFSYQLLNANPYAFLDDAPLEERRARAVATRRFLAPEDLSDLARLDPRAIAQVRREAWPLVRDAEDLHDVLMNMVALPAADVEGEAAGTSVAGEGAFALDATGAAELPLQDAGTAFAPVWRRCFEQLVGAGRAAVVRRPDKPALWIAAERWPLVRALFPDAVAEPVPQLPPALESEAMESASAAVALARGRMDVVGPATATQIADALGLRVSLVEAALEALEAEGAVLRGKFTPGAWEPPAEDAASAGGKPAQVVEWCDRRLLARIHRLTLDTARKQVQPVSPAAYWRFLCQHQHVAADAHLEGQAGLQAVLAQLQGYELPGGAWESDVLPCRVRNYDPAWLDDLALAGEVAWGRLVPPKKREDAAPSGSGVTRVVPISLFRRGDLPWLLPAERGDSLPYARGDAQLVYETLRDCGALFYEDLLAHTGLLPAQLEDALSELAALGVVSSDGFATIRQLVTPDLRKKLTRGSSRHARRRARHLAARVYARGGRWSKFPALPARLLQVNPQERAAQWARLLLARYGVVWRELAAREPAAPPWREMVAALRRMEARGEACGGRFVAGVWGEQYALGEAVQKLRQVREAPPSGKVVIFSAADPLNLTGLWEDRTIINHCPISQGDSGQNGPGTNGGGQIGHSRLPKDARVPAQAGNRLAVIDGMLAAALVAGEVQFFTTLPVEQTVEIARALKISAAARNRAAEKTALAAG